MQINVDGKSIAEALAGKKTYLALVAGAVTVVANHYGALPPDVAAAVSLNPNDWIVDLWKIALGATSRSALSSFAPQIQAVVPVLVKMLEELAKARGDAPKA